MEFERLLHIVADEPLFETGLLLAGEVDPDHVRRQLSRWTRSGRVLQLRRGLYALAAPYQKVRPHPFLVANRLMPASYVSLESALAYYDLIPESVAAVQSVTSGRPNEWDTPLGRYSFRHIKADVLHGYHSLQFGGGQTALVAIPAKAMLDLVYLTPGADQMDYLRGLRLQNLEQLDPGQLRAMAQLFDRPKIDRAANHVEILRELEASQFEPL